MLRDTAFATALSWLFLVSTAHAGFTFQFADDATKGPSEAFTVNAGGSVTIDVLIAETGGETGLESSGLSSAAVRVTAAVGAAQLSNSGDISPNSSLFDFMPVGIADSSGTGYIAEATFFNVLTGPEILLGSFTFHAPAGASPGDVTMLTTSLPNLVPGEQDNFLNDGTLIDGLISNDTATITVLKSGAVTPEPSSIVLLGFGLAGFFAGGRRRREVKTAAR